MRGDRLQRLSKGAEKLLRENEPFLKGEAGHEYLNEDEVNEYVEGLDFPDDESDAVDLETLDDELRRIQGNYTDGDGQMDIKAAVAVREHVDITRAQAADHGIWHDLSIRKFPWFVRHRWNYEGEVAMRKKFWTHGVPLDSQSCTFERLWWIAELTRRQDDEDTYQYTRRAFERRRFIFRVFDIKMGRYMPAVYALIEALYDEDGADGGFVSNDVIDEVVQRFRKSGAAMPYEGRNRESIANSLREIRAEVEGE